MPTQNRNPQNDFQQFAQNMRRTALGIKLAKLLFSPGNKSLANPRGAAFITATMKELGFPVPDGVQITLEVAQIIASGEAVYQAYQDYKTVDDLTSVTNPSASTAKGMLALGDRLGWWDANNDTAQMIRVGADIAMIVGSMGTNVAAWMALAMDIAVIQLGASARANQLAQQGVATYMQNLLRPQQLRAAQLVKEFQESQNVTSGPRMTTFGFIAQVAAESPDLWTQLFPQFASWGIDYETYVTVNSSKTTWYGDTQTAHAEYYWRSVRGYSNEQLRNLVFKNLAWPIIFPFAKANKAYQNRGKGSLYSLALLSMLTGLQRVDGDVSKYFDQALLTPSDLGDSVLHDYIVNKKPPTTVKTAGVYIGQQAVTSKAENQKASDARFVYDNRDLLDQVERAGRIDIVRRVPELSQALSKSFTFEPIPFDPADGDWNEIKRFTDRAGQTSEMLTGLGASWRQIRNYFSALAIVDQLRADKFYADWWKGDLTGYAQAIDFIASADQFDADYRRLQMTSMIRGLNTLALGQIAYYLGTTPDKLVKINQDGVTAFVRKG